MRLISKAEDRAIDERKAAEAARKQELEELAMRLKTSGVNDDEINRQVGHKVYWSVSARTGLITSATIII